MSKVTEKTEQLAEELRAINLSVTTRTSKRGVPHIVVELSNCTYSVCYFKRSNVWRVFFPYPGVEQIKVTFTRKETVLEWFKGVVEGTKKLLGEEPIE